MIKKLNFKSRTLDEEIVRDGLCAVSKLSENSIPTYIVGGVATQTYLPTTCRRGTSDIDLAVLGSLNYADFRSMASPVLQWLGDHKYSFETKKGHNSYQIVYSDQEGNASVIEFARKSQNNFNSASKRLEREYSNSRAKIIEERSDSVRICSPEDIIVPKIVRGIGSLVRNPELQGYLNHKIAFPISEHDIALRLNKIRDLKQEAIVHIGDPLLSEKLRFVSDIYDIQLLSEIAGVNPEYLVRVMNDWDKTAKESPQRQQLLERLLPRFN